MSKSRQQYDFLAKLIIIGDSAIGKTSILLKFCEEDFKDTYIATIGVDFKVKTIQVHDKRFKLQIWDTAGQERFKNITQTYYKGALGVVLAYSVTDTKSFESIERWIAQVNETTSPDVKKVLVANKTDLPLDRKISTNEGQRLANKYNLDFLECSAKTGENISELFQFFGKHLFSTLNPHSISASSKEVVLREQCKKTRVCQC